MAVPQTHVKLKILQLDTVYKYVNLYRVNKVGIWSHVFACKFFKLVSNAWEPEECPSMWPSPFPFSSADLPCGGNHTDPEGLLSLDLSGPFTHNKHCIYIINQPLGEQIQINFTHVELEGQSGCSQSYIEVTANYLLRGSSMVFFHVFMFWRAVVFKWWLGQQRPDHLGIWMLGKNIHTEGKVLTWHYYNKNTGVWEPRGRSMSSTIYHHSQWPMWGEF